MWDKQIPYIAYESEMARHERTIKRLLTALVLSIVLLCVSNLAWLWFINQFDVATETVTQELDNGKRQICQQRCFGDGSQTASDGRRSTRRGVEA